MKICNLSQVADTNQHVVVWSGGCDSTLLLKMVASKFGTEQKPVIAVSMKINYIDENKEKMEDESRKKILEELRKRGLYIKHEIISINSSLAPTLTAG